MAFYDLSKDQREKLVQKIHSGTLKDLKSNSHQFILSQFIDTDTYIRKSAYIAIGRIYNSEPDLQSTILHCLTDLFLHTDFKVRQTTINTAGEIGMTDFKPIEHFFEKGLFDPHHSVRNAVIGSMKKTGQKNPKPLLTFANKYLRHPEVEIRREICHGIELRGRTHPEDILPLLEKLQFDKKSRVRKTLVHVIGQIAYKKGCLETVIAALNNWENKQLVKDAAEEILDVHKRYSDFSYRSNAEASAYLKKNLKY